MKRLLLLPLLAIFLPFTAGNATQIIYDTEGNELRSDSNYYVLPASRVIGGGLSAIHTGSCHLFVNQARSEAQLGYPVRFTPRNVSAGEAVRVRLSSDIGIKFTILPITTCMGSLEWHLTARSPESLPGSRKHVAVGREDLMSPKLFRIERDDGDMLGYKLVSCADEGPCKHLGLHARRDKTWLTVSDVPLAVLFRKA